MQQMEQNRPPEQNGRFFWRALKAQLLRQLRDGPGTVLALYLRILRVFRMGGISRRYWKGFAAFWTLAAIVAMVWPWHLPPDTAPAPPLFSGAWWTSPIELNAWKKFPAFMNATFTVSDVDPTTGRIWAAGENGLLAYRDAAAQSTWTLVPYDPQSGCFHVPGVTCTTPPPPQAQGAGASAGGASNGNGAGGATTGTTTGATGAAANRGAAANGASSGTSNGTSNGTAGAPAGTTPATNAPSNTDASRTNANPASLNPPANRNPSDMIQQAAPNQAAQNQSSAAKPARNSLLVTLPTVLGGETLSGVVIMPVGVSTPNPFKLEVFLDNRPINASNAVPSTITLDTTKIPNGKHELMVTATTADGATGSSKPVTIVINNPRKAAAAALANPQEYSGARLQLASFSARSFASRIEKPPVKRSPPKPAASTTRSRPARPPAPAPGPAQPPPSVNMDWIRTDAPTIIALDLNAKPLPLLIARDGRYFESPDGGSTWTLSQTQGFNDRTSNRLDESFWHRWIGRRYFYFGSFTPGQQWFSTPYPLQKVTLAGGRSFEMGPGYSRVSLQENGKQISSWPVAAQTVQSIAATNDAKYLWFACTRHDGSSYIARSTDLGKTWYGQLDTNKFTVRDLSFDAAGQRGVAVGDNGAILMTTNGGDYWAPVTRGAANPDAQRAEEKAAASGGSAARDADDLLFSHYWRLPPLWTLLLLLLAFCAAAPAIALAWVPLDASRVPGTQTVTDFLDWWYREKPPVPEPPSVANEALSDRPLEAGDTDQLQFTPLARGLSGFLSNPKTLLPVTIAIQGGWGTGKSSLMNLLRNELTAIKFRPVWFNAWHHQEDENLLASMLQAVRSEAVPGFFSTAGMWFRVRLAWRRSGRNLQGILGMVFVLAVLCGAESYWHNIPHDAIASAMARWNGKIQEQASKIGGAVIKPVEPAKTEGNPPSGAAAPPTGQTPSANSGAPPGANRPAKAPPEPSGTLLGYLLALVVNFYSLLHVFFEPAESFSFGTYVTGPLPALYVMLRIVPSAWKQLRAFGANPATLLHTAAPGASDKQLAAQTSFRTQFAKQFEDVTRALGDTHRLVIFVDDLDRCRPAKVGELLEDLNYVVTAGPCAVVLGIEPLAVKAALGLNFRETAEEREEAKNVDPANLLEVAHAKRAAFAERYIEKLINIELNVPKPTDEELEKLLKAAQVRQPTPSQRRAQAVVRWSRLLEPAFVGMILAALGWGVGEGVVGFANWRAEVRLETIAKNALTAPPPAGGTGTSGQAASAGTATETKGGTANLTAEKSAAQAPDQNAAPGAAAAGAPVAAKETKRAALPLAVAAESPFPGLWLSGWRLLVTVPAFVLALLWPATRERRAMAKDSAKFNDARQVWAPVIIQRFSTPRAIKRFVNRLRYLAMLEHPPKQPLPFLEQWVADRTQEPTFEAEGIPEDVLVALASLEAVSADLVGTPEQVQEGFKSLTPEVRVLVEATLKNHDTAFQNVNHFNDYLAAYADLRRGLAAHHEAVAPASPSGASVTAASKTEAATA